MEPLIKIKNNNLAVAEYRAVPSPLCTDYRVCFR